jgi:hypothetical protein
LDVLLETGVELIELVELVELVEPKDFYYKNFDMFQRRLEYLLK